MSRRATKAFARTLLYLALLVLAVPFVVPTLWMISSSFKPIAQVLEFPPALLPRAPTLDPYAQVFSLQPFAQQYWNSLYIAVLVTVGTMVVSSMAGYAFARIPFPGARFLFPVVLLGLFVPNEVVIVPIFQLLGSFGLLDNHLPIILMSIVGAPGIVGTFVMRQYFITFPPELEEAGALDGLSRFGVFRRIAVPLARAPLAAVAITAFLASWNMYIEPLVLLFSKQNFTLPIALAQYVDVTGEPIWNVQMAAASLTVVPVLVVFAFAQRSMVEGLAQSGMKG